MFIKKKLRKALYDQKALDQLITKNYDDVYKYCFYHLQDRDAAQDITQDVFLKFLSKLDDYKEYGKLKNYLYVIAGNSIKDYRKKSRPILMGDISQLAEERTVSSDAEMEQMYILDMIASLGKEYQEIILLRYYQDVSVRDIARIIGKPVSTTRYMLKKAEKRLSQMMEE